MLVAGFADERIAWIGDIRLSVDSEGSITLQDVKNLCLDPVGMIALSGIGWNGDDLQQVTRFGKIFLVENDPLGVIGFRFRRSVGRPFEFHRKKYNRDTRM